MRLPAPAGLFVDTNLLVLYTVGNVNRERIETFKRTSYTKRDFDLLVGVIEENRPLYSVPHVLAEVSNLVDLPGEERLIARSVLRELIQSLQESEVASIVAAVTPVYVQLGLADAAIGIVARAKSCAVLTDDLDLFLLLSRMNVEVFNFNYLRAREMGL